MTKSETVKINVGLTFELPMQYDSDGRRLSPIQLVAPYIEEYIYDWQYNMNKMGGELRTTVDFPYAEYAAVTQKFLGSTPEEQQRIDNNLRESYSSRDGVPYNKWLDGKEDECQELYGMSSREFYRLSWKDRDAVRRERGVEWSEKDNKWSKSDEEKTLLLAGVTHTLLVC